MQRSLDLGCRWNPRGPDGWERWGVDVVDPGLPNVRAADIALEPLPFPDDYFGRVLAYDTLEHIPMRAYVPVLEPADADGALPKIRLTTRNCMVELFSEIYRVLKPGGIFESFTPHVPNLDVVFRDPTHVSFWSEQSWEYFAGSLVEMTRHYGLRATFEMVHKEWRGPHLYVELRAIKDDGPQRQRVAALVAQADALAERGELDGAVSRYRDALDLDERDPEALYGAGHVLLCLGQFDEAERVLEAAVALAPGLLVANRELAVCRSLLRNR